MGIKSTTELEKKYQQQRIILEFWQVGTSDKRVEECLIFNKPDIFRAVGFYYLILLNKLFSLDSYLYQ